MTISAKYDDSVKIRPFRKGDTVRCDDSPDTCAVIGIWGDWIWLDQLDCRNVAPFTARADDYDLVRAAES
jgi:hypothetical protein